MKFKLEKHIWQIICVLLLIVIGSFFVYNQSLCREIDFLIEKQKEYEVKESKAYIVENISKQMEQIATAQKKISDEEREKAVLQMERAEVMRLRANEGENKAKIEQHKAQQYAKHFAEAKNIAELERAKALKSQSIAEYSKNVADTLSFLNLARSLSSNSVMQHQLRNYERSSLLAYAAWVIVKKYKGNLYHPMIFGSLRLNSDSKHTKQLHKGGVSSMVRNPFRPNEYVSVSKYGEIYRWEYDEDLIYKKEFFDSSYSFRDVCIDSLNVIYALDYHGHLVTVDNNGNSSVIDLPENKGWVKICPFSENCLLLASSTHLHMYSTLQKEIVKSVKFPKRISAIGRGVDNWIVFGEEGGCWEFLPDGQFLQRRIEVDELITSYVWSSYHNLGAVGTYGGNVYLVNSDGDILEKLVGHRSKITQISFGPKYLFTSSYDCTLNVWNMASPKKEPLPLLELDSWIFCFERMQTDYVCTGDETGSITRILTSPDEMAALVKAKLSRDFTDDEWFHFFGDGVSRDILKFNVNE